MERRMKTIGTKFQTREEGDAHIIEGYFAVFGSNYDMGDGMSESIARGAFARSLAENDIRCLTNHDSTLVLGRTKANTLELREDDRGLWGRVIINPNDVDAMNTYERVKRGDVDQCSFGFSVREEETEFFDNGDVHWTLKDVDLAETSVCTFAAYQETSISARSAQRDELKQRKAEAWKNNMKERLHNGSESTHAEEKD